MTEREDRFRALFDASYRPLHAYVRRRTCPSDADDIVAEVLTVAWRRLDDIPPGASLPWLYGSPTGHWPTIAGAPSVASDSRNASKPNRARRSPRSSPRSWERWLALGRRIRRSSGWPRGNSSGRLRSPWFWAALRTRRHFASVGPGNDFALS